MDPRSDVDLQLGIAKCQDHTDSFPALMQIERQLPPQNPQLSWSYAPGGEWYEDRERTAA